jgi:hypothetical protein
MSRSGSYNYALNRDQIITRAMQLINLVSLTDSPQSDDLSYAADILNGMVKSWEAEGINLWKRRIAYLFPALSTYSYSIGSTGTNCTNSYNRTTISAAEAAGQTTLSVTSSSGMAASDYVGVELDGGSRQWTTISSVPNSTSIIVAASLTGAAAAGNTVVSYTTKINRPLSLTRVSSIDWDNSDSEIQLMDISYDQYFAMPLKTTSGRPCNWYYDKLLDNGTLYLFPEPNNVNQIISFHYQDALQDFDSATDDMDFPQEWTYPIILNLAVELGYAYGKYVELEKLEPKAEKAKQTLMYSDADTDSLCISVTNR